MILPGLLVILEKELQFPNLVLLLDRLLDVLLGDLIHILSKPIVDQQVCELILHDRLIDLENQS